MKHYSTYQSQFIEMFEGNKYPRLSLDEISKEWSKGQGFKKDDICEDGETQCIHYGELFTKYGPVINEVVSRTSVEKKKTSKKGDILFPASDVTPNGLARCSMLPFDNVILGGDIIILRPKDNYNAAYLSYAINQQTSQLLTRVNGGVVKHMSAKGLKTVEVPIPPIDKQEEYIQIAEQADKSKFTSLKSQFIEMFKDLPINGKIEDLVERSIASVKKSYQSGDEIEYIDISSIDNTSNTVVETTKHEVVNAPSRAQQCVKNGDILVSTVRPINRNIAVVTSNLPNLVASTGFCVLRSKDEYREYLLSVVKSDAYTERMCDKASGGLYPAVNNRDVLSYGIHIPNKELAQKVSSIYQQADKSKYIN